MSMQKTYIPNATACSLLGLLYNRDLSAWDLQQKARKVVGEFWPLTHSQVYRELQLLEAHGLIRKNGLGVRERQLFAISADGKAAFLAWLQETPGEEIIRSPLLIKLSFGQHLDPAKLQGYLEHHERLHKQRLAVYQELREQLLRSSEDKRFLLATLDFGVRYERAAIAWFEDVPQILKLW